MESYLQIIAHYCVAAVDPNNLTIYCTVYDWLQLIYVHFIIYCNHLLCKCITPKIILLWQDFGYFSN